MSINNENKYATASERLIFLRKLLGVTKTEFSRKYNIPINTLTSWETGKVLLTEKTLNKYVKLFYKEGIIVSKDWIYNGDGFIPKKDETTPYMREIFCILRDADNFALSYDNAITMRVKGKQMQPLYNPGDYIGGRIREKNDKEYFTGKDCIVILEDGSKHFRKVCKAKNGKFNLICLNPLLRLDSNIYDVNIVKAAPVIWHRKFEYYK